MGMTYRAEISNTKFGNLLGHVVEVDGGFKAILSAQEYPDLPLYQAPPGESLATSIDEAIEQLRRALNRASA